MQQLIVFSLPILNAIYCEAFISSSSHLLIRDTHTYTKSTSSRIISLNGWLDNFLPAPIPTEKTNGDQNSRRRKEFPEQYPATYELNDLIIQSDDKLPEAKMVRPLLKQTMMESRSLQKIYDAELHGWDARSFHSRVDGKGAAIVIATYKKSWNSRAKVVGGYNPKGWSSNGGARPSVAAFLFYEKDGSFQKLRKCGGGGLACAQDDPNYGISFGPDALVITLQEQRPKFAASKLGPYYERGPDDIRSLFEDTGGGVQLDSLKILSGVYGDGEDIPYSGAVMDMTSG